MKQFGVASGFAMVGWLSVTGAHAASADVAAGKQLALNVCASCHVVAADQPKPPRLTPPAGLRRDRQPARDDGQDRSPVPADDAQVIEDAAGDAQPAAD